MAFKTLLTGDSGTGKTHSLVSLIPTGMNLRLISIENNSLNVMVKALKEYQTLVVAKKMPAIKDGQVGIMIPNRPKRTFDDLLKTQNDFIGKSLDAVGKNTDPDRKKYTRFIEVIRSLTAFVDSKSGESMGTISEWEDDTVLAIDSLTIICEAIKKHVVGGKLYISQPEWGIMQNILMDYLRMLTEDTACNLVMMAHPVKEQDPTLGVTRIYPSNLGQALNNLIPSIFTESIWAYKEKDKYLWSTDDKLAVTRFTYLPCKKDMSQDYKHYF